MRSFPWGAPSGPPYEPLAVGDEDTIRHAHPIDTSCVVGGCNKRSWRSFDRVFARQLLRMFQLLFSERGLVWVGTLFVVSACVNEVAVYYAGLIPSRLFVPLVSKNWDEFRGAAVVAAAVTLGAALGKSLVKLVGGLFALFAREVLTTKIQHRYVHAKTFYRLLSTRSDIDNPDQRIAQDVDKFVETLRAICEHILVSPVLIAYYTYQCWVLSGYFGPAMIYSYFLLGALSSRALIVSLVQLVFMKERHEGNFRYLHVRLRQFAEPIAFSRGEQTESQRMDASLELLLGIQHKIVNRELRLNAVTELFGYFGSVLSYMIIAAPIFAGQYDDLPAEELSGVVSKNAFISIYLIYRFTLIVQQSTKLSDLAGYTARIAELLEALDDVEDELALKSAEEDTHPPSVVKTVIHFEHLSIVTPNGRLLLSDFELAVKQGKSVLIMGPNGSGKTSILRVMAGLWFSDKGRVILPSLGARHELIYLAQTPYLVHGSVRDQITYPVTNEPKCPTVSDDEVRSLLVTVDLAHLERICGDFDSRFGNEWDTFLSPGERQRLTFARLFYWKPIFAALDEATSSLDAVTESHMFRTCRELGITLITVSHSKALVRWHDEVVMLTGNGHYATNTVGVDGTLEVERWIDETLETVV